MSHGDTFPCACQDCLEAVRAEGRLQVLEEVEREFEQLPSTERHLALGALARVAAAHEPLETIG